MLWSVSLTDSEIKSLIVRQFVPHKNFSKGKTSHIVVQERRFKKAEEYDVISLIRLKWNIPIRNTIGFEIYVDCEPIIEKLTVHSLTYGFY